MKTRLHLHIKRDANLVNHFKSYALYAHNIYIPTILCSSNSVSFLAAAGGVRRVL
jgi:hypothetical protein